MFSFLVKGNSEQGAMYIPKSILSLLDSQSWLGFHLSNLNLIMETDIYLKLIS